MTLFACFPEDWEDWEDANPNIISNIDFSPNGRLIASTAMDSSLFYIWNWRDGSLRIFRELKNNACNIRFSPDGRYIVLGMDEGDVLIWDVRTDQLVEKLTGHSDSVYSIAFTPDDMRLVTGSRDGTVKFWDRNFAWRNGSGSQPEYGEVKGTQKELFTFRHPDDDGVRLSYFVSVCVHLSFVSSKSGSHVTFVRVSSNGRWVVSCSSDGVYVWNAQNAEVHFKLRVFEDYCSLHRFDFCPTSGFFALGFDKDRQVLLWRLKEVLD